VITIADVALRAGVSKTTVSHTLSGKRPVSEETRRKVEQAVQDLGFRPNILAQSLRMQRSQTVALIIPDITNPFYPVLARGLQQVLVEQGYHTFLCNTDGQLEQEQAFVDDVVRRQVDGIVLVPFQLTTEALEEALTANIPVISIGTLIDHPLVDVVRPDDTQGAREATEYLLARGHRRIGMVTGDFGLATSERRMVGYREALEQAGIAFDPHLVVRGNFVRQGGREAMRELLVLQQRPSAVFCGNDLMAIGAMDTVREAGLAIPQDMAIMGFDDIDAASLVSPALTTVLNPAYELGEIAGRYLLERIFGEYEGERRCTIVPQRIVERDSI
jgi:LacI family transcriptional regulator